MTTQLPPLTSFLGHVLGFLNAYLVPIGLVLVLITLLAILLARRSGEAAAEAEAARAPATPPPTARSIAPAPRAPVARLTPPAPTLAPFVPLAPLVAPPPSPEQPVSRVTPPQTAAPPRVPVETPESEDDRHAILVVDDSAVARAMLRRLFETNGYRVVLARDGVEALALITTAHFALLITDLEMPNMNGLELIATVQGGLETEDLPIIAITGHDGLQARVHDYQSLYGIFKKPWNDRELLKRAASLVLLRKPKAPAGPLRRSTDVRV